MAEQQENIIIDVKIDKEAAAKQAADLERDLLALRKEQQQLKKAVADGTITEEEYARELVRVKGEIKSKSSEQRNAVKTIEAEENSINALRAELSRLTAVRNKTDQSTMEGVKAVQKMDAELLSLTNRIKQNEEASGDFRRNVGRYKDSILEAAKAQNVFGINVGEATNFISSATGAVNGSTKALQLFKVALIGSGIGAFLVLLGTMVSYFTNTQRGADKLNQILAALSTTMDVLKDRASMTGEAIGNMLQGNFSEGWQQLRQAGTGVLKEINDEARAGMALTERAQQIEKDRVAFIVREAELRRQIEFLRTEGENQALSTSQREESLGKALELNRQLTTERLRLQKEEIAVLEQRQALGENMIEDDRELAELRANNIQTEAQAQELQRTVTNQINTIRKQSAKEQLDAQKAMEEQHEQERLARSYENAKQIAQVEEQAFTEMQQVQNPAADPRFLREQQVSQLIIQSREDERAAKESAALAEYQLERQLQLQKLDMIGGVMGQMADLFGEQTMAYKAIASTEAAINTYLAATNALAQTPLPPPFPQIAAGVTIAFGLAQVARINELEFAEGGALPDYRGGVARGPSHDNGGIPFRVGQQVHEMEGDEIIMTKGVYLDPTLRKMASDLNVMGGGRSFYAAGGVAGMSYAGQSTASRVAGMQMQHAVQQLGPIKVSVTEINEVEGRMAQIQETSNF